MPALRLRLALLLGPACAAMAAGALTLPRGGPRLYWAPRPRPTLAITALHLPTAVDGRRREARSEARETEVVEELRSVRTSPMIHVLFYTAILLQIVPPASAVLLSVDLILQLNEMVMPMYITAPLALEVAHYAFSRSCTWKARGSGSLRKADLIGSDRLTLWQRCLHDRSISTRDFITGWFYRRPGGDEWVRNEGLAVTTDAPLEVEELKRCNVLEWMR